MVSGVDLAQDRDRMWAVVNMVMNLRGSVIFGEHFYWLSKH